MWWQNAGKHSVTLPLLPNWLIVVKKEPVFSQRNDNLALRRKRWNGECCFHCGISIWQEESSAELVSTKLDTIPTVVTVTNNVMHLPDEETEKFGVVFLPTIWTVTLQCLL